MKEKLSIIRQEVEQALAISQKTGGEIENGQPAFISDAFVKINQRLSQVIREINEEEKERERAMTEAKEGLSDDEIKELVHEITANFKDPHVALLTLARELAETDDTNDRQNIYMVVMSKCLPHLKGVWETAEAILDARVNEMRASG